MGSLLLGFGEMLEPNVVFVWRIALNSDWNGDEEQAARWKRLLSEQELRKANAFRTEGLRCHYVMSHGALRVVLGACLGMEPAAVMLTVERPAEGDDVGAAPSKPALDRALTGSIRNEAMADLRFNLSHTSGAALIAVTLGREVGVDIERIRPLEDLEAIGQSIFSGDESADWAALGEDDRVIEFYRVWTRKEAYLKAIGLGLYRDLQDVTAPVCAGVLKGAEGARHVRDATGEKNWWVTDVPVAEGFSGAVCWEGGGVSRVTVVDLSTDLDMNLDMTVDGFRLDG